MKPCQGIRWLCLLASLPLTANTAAGGYDPLAIADERGREPFDFNVHDARRQRDIAPIGDIDMASRLAVFPALPPGSKYELVLHDAEHSAFSDHALRGDAKDRNANHHRVVLSLSTAFWDAYLREDPAARAWLEGSGPSTVLEDNDRWQRK